MSDWVFGYASLVALPDAAPATLRGWRRVWGVAMDNSIAVPGYKVYERPDGARPACAVAFLDLERDGAGGSGEADAVEVDGALIAAGPEALERLDARERQYRRVEVTDALADAPPAGDRVWTYVGRGPGRARVAAGRAGDATVVIQRAYAERVERAFAARGADALARYRASTESPPFPVVELARVDLPPTA
ncbi:MAG TPA: gamma-glutamylcyclotransferase family protein [Baekduia sp.]|uniref:gamma-glutamylcyclotransferase family protein n=1 Tax=Baekduia sp. TaxID=2600305 RepID=UPI002D78D7BE|nr:gamma-glutamylcyclotransferase family protein [Baekduia sp.]HET6507745.1 gamma-glutamylcyclotransferase family protein [Baekduia sp.]